MKEKFCPMTGKPCTNNCGWYTDTYKKCSMNMIGDSLHDLMMSITGEWKDEPAARIADATENIGDCIVSLEQTIKNIDFQA